MATVKEILGTIERHIFSVNKDKTVADAVSQLVENEIGALVVVEGEKPVGCLPRGRTQVLDQKGRTPFQGHQDLRGNEYESYYRRSR